MVGSLKGQPHDAERVVCLPTYRTMTKSDHEKSIITALCELLPGEWRLLEKREEPDALIACWDRQAAVELAPTSWVKWQAPSGPSKAPKLGNLRATSGQPNPGPFRDANGPWLPRTKT